jgi:hypothetical protein
MLWTLSGGTTGGGSSYPAADVYDLDFRSGRANSSSLTAAGFTFTRTSTAWNRALTSFAAGVPVIDSTYGIYVNPQRTNLYSNSTTPAVRTLSLGAPSDYACTCLGSGSVAISGPVTATATEASYVALPAPTVGSYVFTPSGTLSYVGVESGGVTPTLPIVTATGSVVRAPESCARTRTTATSAQGTIAVRARSPANAASVAQVVWELNNSGINSRISLLRETDRTLRFDFVSSAIITASGSGGALADATDFVAVLAWQAGDQILKSTLGADVTAALALPPSLTQERIGSGANSLHWSSSVYRIACWSTRLPNATLDAIKAAF